VLGALPPLLQSPQLQASPRHRAPTVASSGKNQFRECLGQGRTQSIEGIRGLRLVWFQPQNAFVKLARTNHVGNGVGDKGYFFVANHQFPFVNVYISFANRVVHNLCKTSPFSPNLGCGRSSWFRNASDNAELFNFVNPCRLAEPVKTFPPIANSRDSLTWPWFSRTFIP
jgi:hypothetical protein